MGLISASVEVEGEIQRRQVSGTKLLRHTWLRALGSTDVFYFYQIVQMPRNFRTMLRSFRGPCLDHLKVSGLGTILRSELGLAFLLVLLLISSTLLFEKFDQHPLTPVSLNPAYKHISKQLSQELSAVCPLIRRRAAY